MLSSESPTESQRESKRTYISLLQNKVLGIDNPHLLHEIHNVDDYKNSYTQMQKDPSKLTENVSPTKSAVKSLDGTDVEMSPYNSKFNVLKLSSSKTTEVKKIRPRGSSNFGSAVKTSTSSDFKRFDTVSPVKLGFDLDSAERDGDARVNLFAAGMLDDDLNMLEPHK